MSYADVNGLSLYYEEHGSGDPLVLLHGGIGAGELLAPIVPALAAGRRVIAVDLPGHGHSGDVDRPLSPELMADDIAGLIRGLGLGHADVMGYSLGGLTAVRTAIQHPDVVRRLVAVSVAFRRDGSHADAVAAMDAMSPALAEPMKASPLYEMYSRIAPRPDDWTLLIERTSEALKVDYDWTAEAADITAPVMLVYADADSIRPDHVVEAFGLFGGGLHDAGWDGSQRPVARLAVLPGTTHYDVSVSPALAPAVVPFLDAPALP
jgi:pimeloyl-ACP methyl ester carboxylesterase